MKIVSRFKEIILYYIDRYRRKKRDENADHNEYDVEEIFLHQNKKNGYSRWDIVVRYLAVENYYEKNDFGFDLYRKMQEKRIKPEYVEASVDKFKELIKSYEEKGYDKNSEIVLDSNLNLVDGSHRMALALYHGQKNISCKVYNEPFSIDYGMEWFLEHDFSINEIDLIKKRCDELMKEHMRGLSLILWPPVAPFFDEIIEKLSLLYDIRDIKDYDFPEVIFERAVKGIYHIDDIEEWKIDKKLEYMKKYPPKVRMAYIYSEIPEFRRKKINKKTLSGQGEKIKKVIRNCYKNKIEDYFYDIIIHTADNYEQSEYISDIFNAEIPMKQYLETIKDMEWMLIKTETEYMPDNFPDEIPFSKDADIISSESDYNKIIKVTKEFFETYIDKKYEIRLIENENKFRIRIEKKGFLIYQIDISKKVDGLKPDFVSGSLARRKLRNGYYVSDDCDEVYYRMNEYHKNPKKEWHLKYAEEHREIYDEDKMNDIREAE